MMFFDPFRPLSPLVFTTEARRLLALALLQADDERIVSPDDNDDVPMTLGLLQSLGLVELVAGGYVATEMLRLQPWAAELRQQPFPD